MSKDKYPFDMEVLTKQNQIVKGDWTYTLLKASEGSGRVLIDNTNPKKPNKSVCVPLSAILDLINIDK
tara:strand:+ start:2134 stop:2337 length:204 start_codon:yes stop_codon:yes gene_type:complete